jgi:hypothetical protein
MQLIPISLDVVESISNDNIITSQESLDGRQFGSSSILLKTGCGVHISGQTQRLLVDVVNIDLGHARICRFGYLGFEEVDKLLAAVGLAGAWKTGYGNELQEQAVSM